MTKSEKLRLLQQNNPFISSSTGDPWKSQFSDVPSINQYVFQGLIDILHQLSNDPSISCSCLVLGEVGSGKTHLICRLLAASATPKYPFSFSYVQPIEDPGQTFRYLLKEIFHSLCQPAHASYPISPIDRLIGNMIIATLKQERVISDSTMSRIIENDPLCLFNNPQFTSYLNDITTKSIQLLRQKCSKIVLKVLFQYHVPQKKAAAFDWLKGDVIDQDDAALLGVYDRQERSTAAIEQESRDIIIDLGNLLETFNAPLLVCFDRLENLTHDDQIHSLGRMIEFIVDTPKSMLPVIFSRGQQWEEKFRHKFNQQVVTRLETNEFKLKGCSKNQVIDIIRSRLQSVFKENDAHELYPFEPFINEISDFDHQFSFPRDIITQANRYLKSLFHQDNIASYESFETAYTMYVNTILSDINHYPPDRHRLSRALSSMLFSRFTVSDLEPYNEKDKYVDIKCRIANKSGEDIKCAFIIDLEKHHRSVDAALNRAIDLQNTDSNICIYYIRDKRCPIPEKWISTRTKLNSLEQYGIQVLCLETEDLARWYALALMHYDIQEGNLTIPIEGKIITPGFSDLYDYIQSIDYFNDILTIHPKSNPKESQLLDNLYEIVKYYLQHNKPHIVKLSKLQDDLLRKGIQVTETVIENTLSRFNEFQFLPSGDGRMVMLKTQY